MSIIKKQYHCIGPVVALQPCTHSFFFTVEKDYEAVLIQNGWSILKGGKARCEECTRKVDEFIKRMKKAPQWIPRGFKQRCNEQKFEIT